MSLLDGVAVLTSLRRRLSAEGLHIALPIGQAVLDEICVSVGLPPVSALLPGAGGGIVIGDGGPLFFSRFQHESRRAAHGNAPDPSLPDPLDDYTRAQVARAVNDVLAGRRTSFRILYPFDATSVPMPFQRLGQAAGLPAAGPLGLQIHPTYGPWWAYRALLILALPLAAEPPIGAPCADCPQPCVAACPAAAVLPGGFLIDRCVDHRLSKLECRESCAARLRCPVGPGNEYPDEQLAFHMKASLIQASLYRRPTKR